MANITTLPFRLICKRFGADIVYAPMISANAVIHNPERALKTAEFLPEEQPVIVQLFGYDGNLIGEAANIVSKKIKPAGIDINLGCPAPKITGNECGSGLLRDLKKAEKLIRIVRDKFSGELSVKLRLGWASYNILEFVGKLDKLGVDAIAVHGRIAKQGYKGDADWDAIYEIAKNVKIPVIGNGDIDTWQKAEEKALGSVSGVMIGRAALGHPWIFQEIKEKSDYQPTKKELIKIIKNQAETYIKYAGERRAMLELRKHLGWYFKGFPGALALRKKAVQISTKKDLNLILKEL